MDKDNNHGKTTSDTNGELKTATWRVPDPEPWPTEVDGDCWGCKKAHQRNSLLGLL